ncbi:Uracil-DNA glycosylase [Gracilaria domingensis]|nr:Uracil-DNA glycosylase [Gracilaria domingensis]
MQKSITSYFKRAPAAAVNKKRSTALTPIQAQLLKDETLPADVKARIAANRAAARAKLLARNAKSMKGKIDLGSALEPSWRKALSATMKEPFLKTLTEFVSKERQAKAIYPPPDKVFSAFNHSSFVRTRVVIIGQDPYHGPNQAHGMCFSVPQGVYPPPSLQNIFRELETDIPGFVKPKSGCLEKWANQGVLLLNSVLTVQRAQPASHRGRGWERFTDAVVDALNRRPGPGLVFMLWGGYAKKKGATIDSKRHCVLKAVHPSPMSANSGGWFGNKHFSKANEFLTKTKQDVVDWKL